MKKKTLALLIALVTFVVGVAIARFSLPNLRRAPVPAGPEKKELQLSNYRLSVPYQHENLTIFLVYGPDQPNSRMFTPLEEAMARKVVMVHETNEVNELAIKNVSTSEEVFVQAGDIVKGGRQDRVLSVDLILPANSSEVPISAFCIEHGRWSQREGEPTVEFSVSKRMLSTKELKLAAREKADQGQVWAGVATAQEKLSDSVAYDTRSEVSASSLELTLDHGKVDEAATKYVDKLASIVEDSNEVIGFVFAINDELNSADVYSSSALFKRFWPRLLKAAAVEAVAERTSEEKRKPLLMASVGDFLIASEKGSETLREITPRTHMAKRDAEKSVFFETRDMEHGGAWIHRSYLTK